MSDLNDFFAKKDKKKKKPSKAASTAAPASETGAAQASPDGAAPEAVAPDATGPSTSRGGKDDGWIDIDDTKAAQVNTGGRTVADFNKKTEGEKSTNGVVELTEKFSGWTAEGEGEGEEEGGKPKEVGAAPVTAYPSLADTADAPKVPKNAGPGGGGVVSSRPRYGGGGGGGFGALKKKLEEMRAAEEAKKQ